MQVWDYAFSLLFPLIPLCILKGTSGLAIYQTPLVTVIEGGTAIMNCTLSEESLGPVRWYKGGNHQQQLLYSQFESEKPDPRVTKTVKEGPTRETDHSITFTFIRLEDAGVYYCVKFKSDKVTVAANGSGTHLHVNSTSVLTIYQTPSVTVIERDTAIMNCTLSEESLGPVRWYKGGNQQQQLLYSQFEINISDGRVSKTVKEGPTRNTDYTITFKIIRLEDAGVYYCVKFKFDKVTVLANGSGTHLYVNKKYGTRTCQTPPCITVSEGGTAIMECVLSDESLGPVRWYKGGNQQPQLLYSQSKDEKSDPRVNKTVKEGLRRDTDHSITFSRIRLEDAGVYYCVKFKSDKVTVATNGSETHLYVNSK
ncbi:signal-regulatory protein beta-2-like [Protopterus annectens]|uniref:signal-regulatory protein beta-2-like n=1 Tax=Protopterus annectens TaxID=7888 RepID=UPI001CFA341B|nr:signal-regulatory protein beta-2-like [Protopterus annectens]